MRMNWCFHSKTHFWSKNQFPDEYRCKSRASLVRVKILCFPQDCVSFGTFLHRCASPMHFQKNWQHLMWKSPKPINLTYPPKRWYKLRPSINIETWFVDIDVFYMCSWHCFKFASCCPSSLNIFARYDIVIMNNQIFRCNQIKLTLLSTYQRIKL